MKLIEKAFTEKYGMIIVDACHHVAAFTFESILKSVHAKYIYGLSATPVRKDGHHPIIFMQCGPIRYLVDAKSQAEKRAFSHFVIPRFTRTRLPNAGGIQDLYAGVAVNSDRNDLLIADTLKLIQEGRTPILLTERKEHAAMFASLLEGKVQNVFMLVGSDKQKDKREKLSALQDIPPNEDVVVVATGKYDLAGRVHPKVRATHVASLVSDSLEGVVVPWIAAWRDEICIEAQEHMKVPSFCKDDDGSHQQHLLLAKAYDSTFRAVNNVFGFFNFTYTKLCKSENSSKKTSAQRPRRVLIHVYQNEKRPTGFNGILVSDLRYPPCQP